MQLSMFKKKNASLSVGARGFAPPAILFCISTYPIEILSRVVTFCDEQRLFFVYFLEQKC